MNLARKETKTEGIRLEKYLTTSPGDWLGAEYERE